MESEMKRIIDERESWEKEKKVMTTQRNEEEYQRAMAAVDNQILGTYLCGFPCVSVGVYICILVH